MTATIDTPVETADEPNPCPNPEKRVFDTQIEALAFAAQYDEQHGTDTHPCESVGANFGNSTWTIDVPVCHNGRWIGDVRLDTKGAAELVDMLAGFLNEAGEAA